MTAPTKDAEVIVARDLLDHASAANEIAGELEYAAKALADAYLGDRDEAEAKAGALALLRSAREGIAELIAEVERAA